MTLSMTATPLAVIVENRGPVLDYTCLTDTPAGAVVPLGTFVGITTHPKYAGEIGGLVTHAIADFPLYPGQAISMGTTVYWDSTNSTATSTSGYSAATEIIGKCVGNSGNLTTIPVTDLASSNSTTVTSASGVFASLCVGSQIQITSGTNFVAGTYTLTAIGSSTSATFSSNPTNGGSATGGTGLANAVGALTTDTQVRVEMMPQI